MNLNSNKKFSYLKRLDQPVISYEILSSQDNKTLALDQNTGQLVSFTDNRQDIEDGQLLVDRYSLQSIARQALPSYRVAKCQRLPISKLHHISVYKNIKFNSAFFGGLQTCGSVWHCPVCAAKISEKRAIEVQQAIDYCQAQGGVVSFITRTVPHSHNDDLLTILTKYRQAEKALKGHRNYRSLVSQYGIFGSIKVYELTVGINGWHLHIHEILLHAGITPDVHFYEVLEDYLYTFWSESAMKSGFEKPSRAHGLQVQNGDFAAAYLAKFAKQTTSNWTLSREMTKQHIKKSKSGFSPFDLMRAYRDNPSELLLELITEYGLVMHGAQQLIWSRGLKKLVNIEIKTDETLATEIEEESILLGLLSLKQWKFIIKNDYRATVLIIAKTQGFNDLIEFLAAVGAPDFE